MKEAYQLLCQQGHSTPDPPPTSAAADDKHIHYFEAQ